MGNIFSQISWLARTQELVGLGGGGSYVAFELPPPYVSATILVSTGNFYIFLQVTPRQELRLEITITMVTAQK